MFIHCLFSSYEGQQEVANRQYSSAFIIDTLRFVRLDTGSRARFSSSIKGIYVDTNILRFLCMRRPLKAFHVQN